MPSERYYLDTTVLIHFDNNGLLDALRIFAENTHARLLTTKTVLDETALSPKYRMSDLFSDMVSNGVIEVVDDVIYAVDRVVVETETLTMDLGPGESSLMKLVVHDKAHGKPVLVSNDGDAFDIARGIGIDAMLEADYLALLVREGIVTCSDALLALENMLAKSLSRRRAALGKQYG